MRRNSLAVIAGLVVLVNAASALAWQADQAIPVHPTKAYVVSWIPRILSMRNSGSLNP